MSSNIVTLPFVKDVAVPGSKETRRCFWVPECAGLDYETACQLGTDLAIEALHYMRAYDFPALLGWAAMDMPPGPDEAQKGAMVGFFSTFARFAMIAAEPDIVVAYERRQAAWRAYWRQLVAEEAGKRRPRRRAA